MQKLRKKKKRAGRKKGEEKKKKKHLEPSNQNWAWNTKYCSLHLSCEPPTKETSNDPHHG